MSSEGCNRARSTQIHPDNTPMFWRLFASKKHWTALQGASGAG
jgi:hypothetical protein